MTYDTGKVDEMSRALVCDNCGESLTLNARGEHDGGEDAAWLRLEVGGQGYDLCTRSCVVAFLEHADVIAAHDAYAESITGVARAIAGEDDSQ